MADGPDCDDQMTAVRTRDRPCLSAVVTSRRTRECYSSSLEPSTVLYDRGQNQYRSKREKTACRGVYGML